MMAYSIHTRLPMACPMWARSQYWKAVLLACFSLTGVGVASADARDLRHSIEVVQKLATGFDGNGADMARLEIRPRLEARFTGSWRAGLALRLEAAGGDVGLGTLDTFDDLSRPLKLGPDARVEIDQATLSWRKRSTRLTFGKQSLAWGVLDGLQVTDRFDATRRREAVFIDQRPDRISRWGARAEFERAGLRWDVAALIDGTADQYARPGETYSVRAPRFRAGLPVGAPLPELVTRPSSDLTLGLKASRRFGTSDASLLVIHGPDTEPVFRQASSAVTLDYQPRTLVGATWQRSAGPRVWRVETAWIADQPVNLEGPGLPVADRQRWLGGIGVDWDLPDGIFLNAQIGADHVKGERLIRPHTDVIGTLKLQKPLADPTVNMSVELLGSLSDGDGTVRPAVSWQFNDTLRLQGGFDLVWGKQNGLFGQFRETDRAWIKATFVI